MLHRTQTAPTPYSHPAQQQQPPPKTVTAVQTPFSAEPQPTPTRHGSGSWESQVLDGMKKVGQAAFKEVVKDASVLVAAEVDECFEDL